MEIPVADRLIVIYATENYVFFTIKSNIIAIPDILTYVHAQPSAAGGIAMKVPDNHMNYCATLSRRRFMTNATGVACAATIPIIQPHGASATTIPSQLPAPTAPQLAWQEAELGLVYHYDLHIFDDVRYKQKENRKTRFADPDIFNPVNLDTDQWIAAAKACGARFAIITASHETGFRLWQSDVNPFSVKALKWGDGKRDIVGEFIESCRSAGIRPGVYMGARWNGQLGVLNFKVTDASTITQQQYNRLIEREVEEICSRYGPLFELWFDGGILAPGDGGPDVLPIFERHQPDCLFYHSDQRRDARWGGTESGTVSYPHWSTIDLDLIKSGMWNDNVQKLLMHGDPDGPHWCPAMADAPLRNHEWFWEPGDEEKLYSVEALVDMYYKSVGRNATLILGATPDSRGLVPDADMTLLDRFGDEIRGRFSIPAGQTAGTGSMTVLDLPSPARITHVDIGEDIRLGQCVRAYRVEALVPGGTWRTICSGESIGHRRIERVDPIDAAAVRLTATETAAETRILHLRVFDT